MRRAGCNGRSRRLGDAVNQFTKAQEHKVMKKLATLAAIATTALCSAAHAQSFNCNYARTPDEVLICQDQTLISLDEQLAELYFAFHNRAYAWRQSKLEHEQANWLRWRMSCGRDYSCVRQAYEGRIAELRDQQRSVCGYGPNRASDDFCNVGRSDLE
jgi:uncharacterized protein